jgi:hypothetical protein
MKGSNVEFEESGKHNFLGNTCCVAETATCGGVKEDAIEPHRIVFL